MGTNKKMGVVQRVAMTTNEWNYGDKQGTQQGRDRTHTENM